MPRAERQGQREKRISWVRSGQDGTGLQRLEKQLGLFSVEQKAREGCRQWDYRT